MSLLPPKVTLMSVSTSNTYMKLQNFRKLGKIAKLSKKHTLPISGQNLFPQWCPLIRDYTAFHNLLVCHQFETNRCNFWIDTTQKDGQKFFFKDSFGIKKRLI